MPVENENDHVSAMSARVSGSTTREHQLDQVYACKMLTIKARAMRTGAALALSPSAAHAPTDTIMGIAITPSLFSGPATASKPSFS